MNRVKISILTSSILASLMLSGCGPIHHVHHAKKNIHHLKDGRYFYQLSDNTFLWYVDSNYYSVVKSSPRIGGDIVYVRTPLTPGNTTANLPSSGAWMEGPRPTPEEEVDEQAETTDVVETDTGNIESETQAESDGSSSSSDSSGGDSGGGGDGGD